MPSVSEAQRRAMGAALAVKRGDAPASSLYGASKNMVNMTEQQLKEFASKSGAPTPKKRKFHFKNFSELKK